MRLCDFGLFEPFYARHGNMLYRSHEGIIYYKVFGESMPWRRADLNEELFSDKWEHVFWSELTQNDLSVALPNQEK